MQSVQGLGEDAGVSKYHAIRTTIDGINFASRKEALRYCGIPGNRQRDVERLMRKMGYTVKDSAFEGAE